MPESEIKPAAPTPNNQNPQTGGFFSQLRWAESYVSLLLGVVVVVILALLVVVFLRFQRSQQALHTIQQKNIAQVTMAPIRHKTLPSLQPSAKQNIVAIAKATPTLRPTATTVPTATLAVSPRPKADQPLAVTPAQQMHEGQKTYVVAAGDTLWSIAEKTTGSGYNWSVIAQANNLSANPGLIFSGNKLVIPSSDKYIVKGGQNISHSQAPPSPTQVQPTQNNTINTYEYTVQKGDTLWDIAVRAYADGYRWPEIAKANDLANPSLIHSGNVLNIPRPKIL